MQAWRLVYAASFVPVDDFGYVFEGSGLEAVEHHLLPLEVLLDGEGSRLLVTRRPITEMQEVN